MDGLDASFVERFFYVHVIGGAEVGGVEDLARFDINQRPLETGCSTAPAGQPVMSGEVDSFGSGLAQLRAKQMGAGI